MPLTFTRCEIPDVFLVRSQIFSDDRGTFQEVFKSSDFAAFGLPVSIKQVNVSRSRKHVLRGLHYQLNPVAMAKFIRVVSGTIFDVAVDLRKNSATFGKWVGYTLSAEEGTMFYIPEGFAHGFCVLSHEAEMTYYCTSVYSHEHDRSILWSDPALAIQWPVSSPVLSDKDAKAPVFSQAEMNF